ncbi:hypothetical protein LOK49_Contig411G00006 [Camellia lanceoleosa]|nr:hypothetical protein LOK49_Contig411G00006 [Camellia lanceoleosa]
MATKKKGEEARMGNIGGTDMKIRDQAAAMGECETSNPQSRKDVFHLITSEWWNEAVKLRLQSWRQVDANQDMHYLSMTPLKSMEDNFKAIRGY